MIETIHDCSLPSSMLCYDPEKVSLLAQILGNACAADSLLSLWHGQERTAFLNGKSQVCPCTSGNEPFRSATAHSRGGKCSEVLAEVSFGLLALCHSEKIRE